MSSRSKIAGILVVCGFVAIAIIYFFVMSGTADVSGNITVGSTVVSREEFEKGLKDPEMTACGGYCVKCSDLAYRELLSTKNKHRNGTLDYSFTAQEGMRHKIVIYLQLDHLTGETGQTLELEFMTDPIKRGDLERNFHITFHETDGINQIRITVTEAKGKNARVFEYPETKIPDIIPI